MPKISFCKLNPLPNHCRYLQQDTSTNLWAVWWQEAERHQSSGADNMLTAAVVWTVDRRLSICSIRSSHLVCLQPIQKHEALGELQTLQGIRNQKDVAFLSLGFPVWHMAYTSCSWQHKKVADWTNCICSCCAHLERDHTIRKVVYWPFSIAGEWGIETRLSRGSFVLFLG